MIHSNYSNPTYYQLNLSQKLIAPVAEEPVAVDVIEEENIAIEESVEECADVSTPQYLANMGIKIVSATKNDAEDEPKIFPFQIPLDDDQLSPSIILNSCTAPWITTMEEFYEWLKETWGSIPSGMQYTLTGLTQNTFRFSYSVTSNFNLSASLNFRNCWGGGDGQKFGFKITWKF